jgi:hypothetical protein
MPTIGFINADLAIPLEQILVLHQALESTYQTLALSSRFRRHVEMQMQEEADSMRGLGSNAFESFVRYFNLSISDIQ